MSDNAPLLRRLDAPYEFDNGEEDESVLPGLAALLKQTNAEKSEAAAEIRRLEAKVVELKATADDPLPWTIYQAIYPLLENKYPQESIQKIANCASTSVVPTLCAREQAAAQRMQERCAEGAEGDDALIEAVCRFLVMYEDADLDPDYVSYKFDKQYIAWELRRDDAIKLLAAVISHIRTLTPETP